jgi:hypothetical protein
MTVWIAIDIPDDSTPRGRDLAKSARYDRWLAVKCLRVGHTPIGLDKEVLRRPLIVLKAAATGFVVSALFFAVAFQVLKLMFGECAPGQHDGQCGLATFMSLLSSFGISLVVWMVAAYSFFRRFVKPSG